jgi:hypothetical protein
MPQLKRVMVTVAEQERLTRAGPGMAMREVAGVFKPWMAR